MPYFSWWCGTPYLSKEVTTLLLLLAQLFCPGFIIVLVPAPVVGALTILVVKLRYKQRLVKKWLRGAIWWSSYEYGLRLFRPPDLQDPLSPAIVTILVKRKAAALPAVTVTKAPEVAGQQRTIGSNNGARPDTIIQQLQLLLLPTAVLLWQKTLKQIRKVSMYPLT